MDHKKHSDLNMFTSQHRRSQDCPQEIECQRNLQRSRPQHVDVCREIHKTLCIDRHQIHNFTNGRLFARGIRHDHCLAVDGTNQCGANAQTDDEHALEILSQDDGLDAGYEKQKSGIHDATPQWLWLNVFDVRHRDVLDNEAQDLRRNKGEHVLGKFEQRSKQEGGSESFADGRQYGGLVL